MNVFRFRNKEGQPLKPAKAERGNGGVSVVTLTKEFIAGDILLKEAIQKQFLFLLLLFVLSLVYVNNRFLYERQLREVNKLRVEAEDIKYRSLVISKELKQAGRRTMILNALSENGSRLSEATEPIVIIEN